MAVVTKDIKVSQWGSDWLFTNTMCTAHLTDSQGEVGNMLGPTQHIKIVNKDKFPITFESPFIERGGVIVEPGNTYFSTISSPQINIAVKVRFTK